MKFVPFNQLIYHDLPLINMADAILQERDSLPLLKLTSSAAMEKVYFETTAKSVATKIGSLCLARQFVSAENILHIYKFTIGQTIAAIYGSVPLLYI